jgi:large subunit ribosomal protein L35
MPKIKTHKSTAKRFKYSGSGKLMRMRQGKGHLRRKKTPKVKATFSYAHVTDETAVRRRVKRLAPYLE